MKPLILFVLCTLLSQFSIAQKRIFTKEGEAIRGYDPVAYFKESKPVKGKDQFKYEWSGAVWKFSSEGNLNDFIENPEKFAPQFGGYCAYGVADNHKASTQPEAWTIVDKKLYLNYSLEVKKIWNEKQSEFIDKANKNWPTVQLEKD